MTHLINNCEQETLNPTPPPSARLLYIEQEYIKRDYTPITFIESVYVESHAWNANLHVW